MGNRRLGRGVIGPLVLLLTQQNTMQVWFTLVAGVCAAVPYSHRDNHIIVIHELLLHNGYSADTSTHMV